MYATQLGGTSNDFGSLLAIDPTGNALVVGSTRSPAANLDAGEWLNFPTIPPIRQLGRLAFLQNQFLARLAPSQQLANLKVSISGPLVVHEDEDATYLVEIINNGPSAASNLRIIFENNKFPNFPDFRPLPAYHSICPPNPHPKYLVLDTCDVPSLGVGDSIRIEFLAGRSGPHTPEYPLTVSVSSDTGNPIPADGIAVAPITGVSDRKILRIQFLGPFSFPQQSVGTASAPHPAYRLFNLGTQEPITLTELSIGNPGGITDASEFELADGCVVGLVIPVGGHCDINVIFAPIFIAPFASYPNGKTIDIILDSDSGSGRGSLSLRAEAIAPGTAAVSTNQVSFGRRLVNTLSGVEQLQLTNPSSGRFDISAIRTTGDFSQTNDCGRLDTGVICNISIYFRPSGTGLHLGTLEIVSNATNSPQTVTLIGEGTTTPTFSITERGDVTWTTGGGQVSTSVGYGRVQPDGGNTTPTGLAIFGLIQSGVLVTEASVPATALVQEGRVFAEVGSEVNTGLAIVNPNDVDATINFYFTDASGTEVGSGNFMLGANEQTAKLLSEAPFSVEDSMRGTLTFSSSVPVSIVALRLYINERSESLITTLPVVPLSAPVEDTIYFPHFVDGAGWTSEVILLNPTDSTITGTVEFFGQGDETTPAAAVSLSLIDGSTGPSFAYSIPPRSSKRFTTSNPDTMSVGSVRASAEPGSASPAGLEIFSFSDGGVTVASAGIAALPTGFGFRVYVEKIGRPGRVGSIRSGLAITDASARTNTVTLELTALDGSTVGTAQTISIPPSGQVARFIDEFFILPDDFAGVVRVSSPSKFGVVGLRARTNERSDLLITTTPPSPEVTPLTSAHVYFPHIVDSAGWSTQIMLFSGTGLQTRSGTLNLFNIDGETMDLRLH